MTPLEKPQLSKETLLEFARQLPFFNLIGLEIVDLGPGWSTTRLSYRTDLCQPAGILHGGMVASLIDTGIAHAILATDMFVALAAEGGHMVSVDLRVKYLRPISEGVITCEAKIPRLGKHIIHGEAIVTNAEGKEVARGDSIYMTVHKTQLSKKE